MIDFSQFDVLTFDVYGTLIDWESGIIAGLQPILEAHGVVLTDDQLLETYAGFEAAVEAGPYLTYRAVLAASLAGFERQYGFTASDAERVRFSQSVMEWPAFADSVAALNELSQRFKLAPITNCDDDLFAASNKKLAVTFDWIITAQQVGSYKPNTQNFEFAFNRIGVPRDRILHVAQSLFHDHVPAKEVGLTTVWINRRHNKPGQGATPPASATPDLELPDLQSLANLTRHIPKRN